MNAPLPSDKLLTFKKTVRTAKGGWAYTDEEFNRRWLKRVMGRTYVQPGRCRWRWQGLKRMDRLRAN